MLDFLCLVFGNPLFVHYKRNQVKGDDKKPPAVFRKVLHSPMAAHNPAGNGCDQQY